MSSSALASRVPSGEKSRAFEPPKGVARIACRLAEATSHSSGGAFTGATATRDPSGEIASASRRMARPAPLVLNRAVISPVRARKTATVPVRVLAPTQAPSCE